MHLHLRISLKRINLRKYFLYRKCACDDVTILKCLNSECKKWSFCRVKRSYLRDNLRCGDHCLRDNHVMLKVVANHMDSVDDWKYGRVVDFNYLSRTCLDVSFTTGAIIRYTEIDTDSPRFYILNDVY